jgi:uncharacterized protein (TIGR02145 family)
MNCFLKSILFLFIMMISSSVSFTQIQFTDSGQSLGNGTSNSVALGDIDGDGDLDAVVANGSYNSDQDVEIWINDGNGNFTLSTQTLNHGKNMGVSLADLNGDGSLDIFLCVGFGGPNKVFFNDGHGKFTDSGQRSGDANSNMVGLADLDGDCDIDAFVCVHPMWDVNGQSYHFGNEVWLNNGKGYFTNTGQTLGKGYNQGIAIGDIECDGDIDAASASNFQNVDNKIWINDGAGNFTESSQKLSNLNSMKLSFGDLDGDGDLDAFIIYCDTNSIYFNGVWFNDGKGNFIESNQKFGIIRSTSVCLGDLDNDGDLDAFVTSGQWQVKGVSKIWLNNGKGVFTDSLILGNDESWDVKLGDLNGDGNLDAFVANNGPNKVWINNSTIANQAPSNPTGLNSERFSTTDVILRWNPASDDHTPSKGLTYNVFVVRNGDTVYTRSPIADTTTGFRMIPDRGISQDTFCVLKNLKGGTYHWGVQAIDVAYKGGLFTKSSFTISATGVQDTVIDIDGNVYQTVTIGTQVWMKENLKTTHYRNGDAIPNIIGAAAWGNLTTGAYCHYNNSTANAAIYGNLYNFKAVTDSRNICPSGWHIPTDAEWTVLTEFLGGDSIAGGKLKESGTTHYLSPNIGADNSSGFTALPGGDRVLNGAFYLIGQCGFFWTATEIDTIYAYARAIAYQVVLVDRGGYNKVAGYSVRCLKDAGTGVDDPTNRKQIPGEMKLNQNYPNPFNPSTVISYQLPAFSNVKLTIYNLLGQKIKTLVNSFQNAGEHSLVWDATDEKNNPVSSGIYFYSLVTNGIRLQKKMIMVR